MEYAIAVTVLHLYCYIVYSDSLVLVFGIILFCDPYMEY